MVGDKALRKLVISRGWDKRIHQLLRSHDMAPYIMLTPGARAIQPIRKLAA